MRPTIEDRDFEPPWLQLARKELISGVREVKGPGSHPRILEYFTSTKLTPKDGDETAWCSAGMCWVMEQSGIRSPRSAKARDWQTWGKRLLQPQMGCVVVLTRGENPNQGHVALWTGESHERMLLLGGNQGDRWSVQAYPKWRLLAYRWPAGYPESPLTAA